MSLFTFHTATKTETGSAHEHNSDSFVDVSIPNGHLLALSDGHNGKNGHAALASKMITEQIKKYFLKRTYTDFTKALTNAFTFANFSLWELTQKDNKYEGVAATLAVLIIQSDKVFYAYAGDSRVYWWHNNELQPLTRDHVKPSESGTSSLEVQNLLGKEKDIRFGISKNPIQTQPGDLFLLCTDGLTDFLNDAQIADILSDADTSPDHKCLLLTNKVKELGGTENTTIQILEILPDYKPKPKKMKHILTILFALGMVIIVGYLSYLIYARFVNAPAKTDKPIDEIILSGNEDSEQKDKTDTFTDDVEISEEGQIENNLEKKESKKTSEKLKEQVQVEPKNELKFNDSNKEKTKETFNQKKESVNTANKKKESEKASSTKESYHLHKIQSGENLYRVSLRYHVSQKKITEINGDKATNFIAGQELKIPVTALHKVVQGDQLKSISINYNVPLDLILAANKMDAKSVLKNGSTLIIPLR